MSARVVYERGAEVTLGNLFGAYTEWCNDEKVPLLERLKSRAFGTYFEERGRAERFKNSAGLLSFKGARLTSDKGSETREAIPRLADATKEYREVWESPSEPLNLLGAL